MPWFTHSTISQVASQVANSVTDKEMKYNKEVQLATYYITFQQNF